MHNITPFTNDKFRIRAITLDGQQWFVGKDIAEALGYINDTDALNRHCRGVVKRYPIPDSLDRLQDTRLISEPDLYRLIAGSNLPTAEKFERWVFEDVLPQIRKTGGYQQRPLTQTEMLLASAQALVDIERKQAQQDLAVAAVEQRIDQLVDCQLMSKRPSNAEAITHIRKRIFREYGLPAHICDQVMRQLPYSPKPAGMVRNSREEAEGSSYAVYWTKDINSVFKRFVSECLPVTPAFVSHPFIDGRFRLTPGLLEAQSDH